MISKNKIFYSFIGILLLLTIFMIYSFMPYNVPNPGHDYNFHRVRFYCLMNALKDSNYILYLDYRALNGYGYATQLFYPDLILVPFAFLANKTSICFSYKIMFGVLTFLCGIFTYKNIYQMLQNKYCAFIGGLLYPFSLYRLQDLYERGALAESISFTFLPIVFYGLYEIIKGNPKRWYILTIGVTLMCFSHVLSFILTILFLFIIVLFNYKIFIKDKERIKYLIIATLTTIVLSSGFIFPLAEQMLTNTFLVNNPDPATFAQHNRLGTSLIINNILCLYPKIGISKFVPALGIIITLLVICRIFIKNNDPKIKFLDKFTLLSIILIILTLDFIPWSLYPLKLLNFIQFPWRFYQYISYFLIVAGSYYSYKVIYKTKKLKFIVVLSIIISITASIYLYASDYKKQVHYNKDLKFEEPNFSYNRDHLMNLEYLPKKFKLEIMESTNSKIIYQNSDTQIKKIKKYKSKISFDINIKNKDSVEFPLTYYKGYTAKLNNKKIQVEESENGLVKVPINNSGKIVVEFTGTIIQRYSIYITLIGSILLIIYIIIINRKKSDE